MCTYFDKTIIDERKRSTIEMFTHNLVISLKKSKALVFWNEHLLEVLDFR